MCSPANSHPPLSQLVGGIMRLATHDLMHFDPRSRSPMGPDGCFNLDHPNWPKYRQIGYGLVQWMQLDSPKCTKWGIEVGNQMVGHFMVGHHKIVLLEVAMTMVRWCLTPTYVSCLILISKSMEASLAVPNPMAVMNIIFHTKAQCTDRMLIGGWQWRRSKNSMRGAALISTTHLSRLGTEPRP